MNPLDAYLKELDAALAKGNSTEHTHRYAVTDEVGQIIETSGGWLL